MSDTKRRKFIAQITGSAVILALIVVVIFY